MFQVVKILLLIIKQVFYQKNNDINTYLEKINLLMNNISLVKKMKKRCLAESRKYDWEKVCKEYLKLYKIILANNLNNQI